MVGEDHEELARGRREREREKEIQRKGYIGDRQREETVRDANNGRPSDAEKKLWKHQHGLYIPLLG